MGTGKDEEKIRQMEMEEKMEAGMSIVFLCLAEKYCDIIDGGEAEKCLIIPRRRKDRSHSLETVWPVLWCCTIQRHLVFFCS